VCELEYSKATANPVRIVLAVPKEHPATSADQLPDSALFPATPEGQAAYFEGLKYPQLQRVERTADRLAAILKPRT